MPMEDYERLPASLRPLMIRAFSYAARARWHELDAPRDPRTVTEHRALAFPAAPTGQERSAVVNVGRNEPCPCGSGKKYKQCHGAFTSAQATS
jgi:uncharacterized protein YecA (UPF0149 family)